jgi:predicted glycoside hydrolase/deacetylase ChbG (UPF0249 family)
MDKVLIVNADDYGRSPGVSAGIRQAHQSGIVTATTVMINLPGAITDVHLALRQTPELALGVHLNLTVGCPCALASDVPSLVDPNGVFLSKDDLHQSPERLDPSEVEQEWRTQIESFLATGARLDHIDSHHHIALLSPDIWNCCLSIASDYGCGVRTPLPSDVNRQSLMKPFPKSSIDFITEAATAQLVAVGVHHVDSFLGSFFGDMATRKHLLSLLDGLPAGTHELMCHPGFADEVLRASASYILEREAELEILTDPAVIECVQIAGIRLSTYRNAWPH